MVDVRVHLDVLSGGDASAQLQAMLAELKAPWESLLLMGFSQGAMLALDLALRAPRAAAAPAINNASAAGTGIPMASRNTAANRIE